MASVQESQAEFQNNCADVKNKIQEAVDLCEEYGFGDVSQILNKIKEAVGNGNEIDLLALKLE